MEQGYKGLFSKMGEGLLEKYLKDALKELQERPNDPEILFKIGVAYSRLNKVDQAREIYKKLKEVDKGKAKELLDIIYET